MATLFGNLQRAGEVCLTASRFIRVSLLHVSLCAAAWPAAVQAGGGGAVPGYPERVRMVVTQLPVGTEAERTGPRSGGMLPAAWGQGARLVLVEGGRILQVLTPGFAGAADPDVSLDGRKILFAAQRGTGDRWAVYEMHADGTGIREVFSSPDDLRQPVYLPTLYTIVPDPTKGTEPREHIGFVRTYTGSFNEHGSAPVSALYSVKLDGTAPRRITFSLSNDMTPMVLRDGRIVYASWQRATLDRGAEGRISLLGVNPDGLDPAVFAADQGLRIKLMPCVTDMPGRLVVFVEAEQVPWDGAGALASVSLRRNLHSYRRISRDDDGLFHGPSPLPDGKILAARRPAGGGTHAIVRVDPDSGGVEELFDDPAFHDLQPRLIAPRPTPDGRSTAVKDPDVERASGRGLLSSGGLEYGKLYGLNVYLNDLGHDLEPGTIARLRIIEGLAQLDGAGPCTPAPRRLVGEAPVETDGSFHVQVPSGIPLQLQILDQDGVALRSSGWVWTHYTGQQGCIGCHEDGELTPTNRFVDALGKPAANLLLPAELRRTVDFVRDIEPIIQSRCTACHGGDAAVDLSTPGAFETLSRFLDPGRARTSPLIWHILGRNTARPWDGAAVQRAFKAMPEGAQVRPIERRLFIEWVDLGALRDAMPGAGPTAKRGTP